MMAFLIVLVAILSVLTAFFAYKAYVFGKIILNIQDAIEDSLEVLDGRYQSISEILQKPVFFDSVEVRQVIEEIGVTRDAVLYIANKIENSQRVNLNDKNDDKEKEDN